MSDWIKTNIKLLNIMKEFEIDKDNIVVIDDVIDHLLELQEVMR